MNRFDTKRLPVERDHVALEPVMHFTKPERWF